MPRLSVIVPTHRSPRALGQCIEALYASDLDTGQWELIVVDDGGDDPETEAVASRADRVIKVAPPARGPAYARNAGAREASSPVVAFVDADVLVHRDALSRMLSAFADPDVSAAFGSYDDAPGDPGFVSQYRNLLHHHVHQRSAGDVESFWAGCGAVRKDAFSSVGMFDAARFTRPEMEDVELGYRLRDAGHRIVLDPRILCTHLKRWTARGMIMSDFTRRGVPWARVLVERQMLLSPRGLSLGAGERISAVAAIAAIAAGAAAAVLQSSALAAISGAALGMFLLGSGQFLAFLARRRGLLFAVRAVPLHLVYNIVAVAALVWGAALAILSPSAPERYRRPR